MRSHFAACPATLPSHRRRLIDVAKPAASNPARSWPTRAKTGGRPRNVCSRSATAVAANAIATSGPIICNRHHLADRTVILIARFGVDPSTVQRIRCRRSKWPASSSAVRHRYARRVVSVASCVPFLPASSHPAFLFLPRCRPPGRNGCAVFNA